MKRGLSIQRGLPLVCMVLLFVCFSAVTKGRFLAGNNMEVLLNQAFGVLVASIGATFVYAHGGMDLSIAGLSGFCMCLIAYCLNYVNWFWALLAAIAVGAVSGFLTSGIAITMNIPSFIVSICMGNIWRGIVLTITSSSWMEVPASFLKFDNWIIKIVAMIVLLIIGFYIFDYTRIGKDMKAIGGNAEVARLSGVRVSWEKLLAFMIMGIFTAITAFFTLARVGVASSTAGSGLDMDVMIALLLGGLPLTGGANSRMICAAVGAFSLAILGNGLILCGVDPKVVDGIKGAVLLVVVFATMKKKEGQVIT